MHQLQVMPEQYAPAYNAAVLSSVLLLDSVHVQLHVHVHVVATTFAGGDNGVYFQPASCILLSQFSAIFCLLYRS